MNIKKVVLMSQLSLYEKKYGKDDIKKSNYYKSDFVYLKNMWTRGFALVGACILIVLYFINMSSQVGFEGMILYIKDNYMKMVYFLLGVIVFYTCLGSFMYGREYKESKRRVESYSRLLGKINKIIEEEDESEEETEFYDEF